MSTITHGFLDHKIFKIVSETAAEQGVRAFVIGGYVRDCFLGRPSKDIDIVVEGSGIAIAEAVAAKVHSNVPSPLPPQLWRYRCLRLRYQYPCLGVQENSRGHIRR